MVLTDPPLIEPSVQLLFMTQAEPAPINPKPAEAPIVFEAPPRMKELLLLDPIVFAFPEAIPEKLLLIVLTAAVPPPPQMTEATVPPAIVLPEKPPTIFGVEAVAS